MLAIAIPVSYTHLDVYKRQVLGQEAVVQTEVITTLSVSELPEGKHPAKSQITSEQVLFEGLETSEATVHESEKSFTGKWKPETTTVETKFQESKSVTVTQVLTQDKEKEYIPQHMVTTETAYSNISEHESIIKSEVIPDNSLEILDVHMPTPSVARQSTPTQQHSLIVTSHDTGEVESSIQDLIKPASKTIPVSFEEHNDNIIVTEVLLQEHEGKYMYCICFPQLL